MQDERGGGAAVEGGKKIPQPCIAVGCSQEDFKFFKRSWNQYVRASNEMGDVVLRDQLLHCPDYALKRAVAMALGDRVNTITVSDLLKEIETLAVVRQNNLVNTMVPMSAKHGEPVRQFAAWLPVLAALCDLTAQCTCQLEVSNIEK